MKNRERPRPGLLWLSPVSWTGLSDVGRERVMAFASPVDRRQARSLPRQRPNAMDQCREDTTRLTAPRWLLVGYFGGGPSNSNGSAGAAFSLFPRALAGAPGRIRTSDPQIRSLVLYPAEL